jgi:hypothetical protein
MRSRKAWSGSRCPASWRAASSCARVRSFRSWCRSRAACSVGAVVTWCRRCWGRRPKRMRQRPHTTSVRWASTTFLGGSTTNCAISGWRLRSGHQLCSHQCLLGQSGLRDGRARGVGLGQHRSRAQPSGPSGLRLLGCETDLLCPPQSAEAGESGLSPDG